MAEFTSHGVGNAALTTGIIGTALGVLGGGANRILGWNGGWNNGGFGYNSEYGDHLVTRYELMQAQTIAAKDSEIALLKSEQNTEIKIADVYERLAQKINHNKDMQDAWNTQQAVYNGMNNAAIGCMRNQIEELSRMTRLVIPADHICPRPMERYNSWMPPVNNDGAATTADANA